MQYFVLIMSAMSDPCWCRPLLVSAPAVYAPTASAATATPAASAAATAPIGAQQPLPHLAPPNLQLLPMPPMVPLSHLPAAPCNCPCCVW